MEPSTFGRGHLLDVVKLIEAEGPIDGFVEDLHIGQQRGQRGLGLERVGELTDQAFQLGDTGGEFGAVLLRDGDARRGELRGLSRGRHRRERRSV